MANRLMKRILPHLLLFIFVILLCVEPVLANKFETIGGGVSGLSRKKIMLLKDISLYAGCFLIFLGLVSFVTRDRYEGMSAMYSRKSWGEALSVPIGLAIVGSAFIGLSYL